MPVKHTVLFADETMPFKQANVMPNVLSRDDPKSMQEARWIDAELINFEDLSTYDATMQSLSRHRLNAACRYAMPRCHDAKRDDAARLCRLSRHEA